MRIAHAPAVSRSEPTAPPFRPLHPRPCTLTVAGAVWPCSCRPWPWDGRQPGQSAPTTRRGAWGLGSPSRRLGCCAISGVPAALCSTNPKLTPLRAHCWSASPSERTSDIQRLRTYGCHLPRRDLLGTSFISIGTQGHAAVATLTRLRKFGARVPEGRRPRSSGRASRRSRSEGTAASDERRSVWHRQGVKRTASAGPGPSQPWPKRTKSTPVKHRRAEK
jgi:hypothetical protein